MTAVVVTKIIETLIWVIHFYYKPLKLLCKVSWNKLKDRLKRALSLTIQETCTGVMLLDSIAPTIINMGIKVEKICLSYLDIFSDPEHN